MDARDEVGMLLQKCSGILFFEHMTDIELCTSMMCANYATLGKKVRNLEEARIDANNSVHLFLNKLRIGDTGYFSRSGISSSRKLQASHGAQDCH